MSTSELDEIKKKIGELEARRAQLETDTSAQKDALRKSGLAKIQAILKEVEAKYEEAVAVADETETSFYVTMPGDTYGGGVTYEPGRGWYSSSDNC